MLLDLWNCEGDGPTETNVGLETQARPEPGCGGAAPGGSGGQGLGPVAVDHPLRREAPPCLFCGGGIGIRLGEWEVGEK